MNIVFSRDPVTPDLTFLDIEDDQGRSIQVGEWSTREDGNVVLAIAGPTSRACPPGG